MTSRPCKRKTCLHTETVTTVRGGTVLSLICEPVVWFHRDPFPLVTIHQFLQITDPHTSAHDLSDTGHEDVDTFRIVRIVLKARHVEGLQVLGESSEHDRDVNLIRHFSFGGLGDIVSVDVRRSVLLVDTVLGEVLDGVLVAHSHEWSRWGLEAGVERIDNLSADGISVERVDYVADDALKVVEEVLELDKDKLGLEVGILGEMSESQPGARIGV